MGEWGRAGRGGTWMGGRVLARGLFIFGSRGLTTWNLDFQRREIDSVCKGDLEYVLFVRWRRVIVELVKKRVMLTTKGCAGFQKCTRRMLDSGKTTTHDKRLFFASQFVLIACLCYGL